MEDRLRLIADAQQRITDKKSKIFFYLPSMPHASGGIGVVYEHVRTLTELGYDAMVVYNGTDYKKPTWLGEPYVSLKHLRLDDKHKPITVTMDDILIIPEGFTNVMENTSKMPCKRIVLCQSYQYVLDSLMPGIGWDYFGIRDVMVVTPTLKTYLENVFGKRRFKITTCRPSVDDKIFKPSSRPKIPIIAISARDPQVVLNLTKHFYMAHPQYKWVSFKHMADLSREGFAEHLGSACLAVWVDRIAGFGTFPIECAKAGTPFIGLIPDIVPEYASNEHGIWTNNLLDIPAIIASYFKHWFEDKEPKEILDGLKDLATMYTREQEIETISTLYGEYFSERSNELSEIAKKVKEEELI